MKMENITIKIEGNPNITMVIPLNQIVGYETSPYLDMFHHGHLYGNIGQYKYILKVQLYGCSEIGIPVLPEDFNRVRRAIKNKLLEKSWWKK